jgi:hypothetical protein
MAGSLGRTMKRALAMLFLGLVLASCSERDVKEFALNMRVKAEGVGAKAAEERSFRPELDTGLAQGPIQARPTEPTQAEIEAKAAEKAAAQPPTPPPQGQIIYYPVN